mmetsp:Transcript_31777/g.48778  ORF Transcript_31777/g.48778 Transcript_31777/m.48778 type:complete len:110 (+) Transcript_31777:109-438(+)
MEFKENGKAADGNPEQPTGIDTEEDPLVIHTERQREQKIRPRIVVNPEKVKANQISALYKIIIIGDSGIGKTSLLLRFSDNIFSSDTACTVGIDIKTKIVKIDGKYFKL